MKRYYDVFVIACVILLTACGGSQSFDHVPLESFQIDAAPIDSSRQFSIIAYSGGKESDKDNIYYHEFITVDEKTNDTLKVLSALICVDKSGESGNNVYSPVTQFEGKNGATTVTIEKQDTTHNMLLNTLDFKGGGVPDPATIERLTDPVTKKQIVEVNKSLDIFSNQYKTVVGILHFTQQPW